MPRPTLLRLLLSLTLALSVVGAVACATTSIQLHSKTSADGSQDRLVYGPVSFSVPSGLVKEGPDEDGHYTLSDDNDDEPYSLVLAMTESPMSAELTARMVGEHLEKEDDIDYTLKGVENQKVRNLKVATLTSVMKLDGYVALQRQVYVKTDDDNVFLLTVTSLESSHEQADACLAMVLDTLRVVAQKR